MTDRIEKARQMLRETLEQYGDLFDDMIPDVQQAIMDEIEGLTRERLAETAMIALLPVASLIVGDTKQPRSGILLRRSASQ